MTRGKLAQRRQLGRAGGFGDRAAAGEAAAGRRVDRAGRVAGQLDAMRGAGAAASPATIKPAAMPSDDHILMMRLQNGPPASRASGVRKVAGV